MGRKANPKPDDKVTNNQKPPKEDKTDKTTVSDSPVTPSTEDKTDDKTETPPKEDKTDGTEINFDSEKEFEIVCAERAGRNFYGCTGKLIHFNEDGIAVVCAAEARHYSIVDGCKIREHKDKE